MPQYLLTNEEYDALLNRTGPTVEKVRAEFASELSNYARKNPIRLIYGERSPQEILRDWISSAIKFSEVAVLARNKAP